MPTELQGMNVNTSASQVWSVGVGSFNFSILYFTSQMTLGQPILVTIITG